MILNSPISKVVILFFLWEFVIGALSYMKGFGIESILRSLSVESLAFIAIFIPLIESLDGKKEKFFQYTILLGVAVILFGIMKYTIFHEIQLTSSATKRTLDGNAVIILLFPLCNVLFASEYWRKHNLQVLLFIMVTALGVQFAGHRSGWIVFFFVCGMWFLLSDQKIRLAWIPLWGTAMVTLLVIISFSITFKPGTLFGDFLVRVRDTANLQNETTQERLSKWKFSFETIEKYPLLGLGRYPIYTEQLFQEHNFLGEKFSELNRAPHNMIAEKAIHEGILGLGVLAVFLYVIFNEFSHVPDDSRQYYNFLRVYILSFLIFSMFNTSFNNPMGLIFFFISLGFLNAETVKRNYHSNYILNAPNLPNTGGRGTTQQV